MAKYVYPAVFAKEDCGYSIRFPDFDSCYTSAENTAEGLEMANDVLCLTLYDMEQGGMEVPQPSEVNAVPHGENEFVTLVACDTDWYRRYYESKSVKKTLSIPAWLNDMAERNALNFSAILQAALKRELNL
jgi:predicted RNase H-like HicB family nuclease